MTADVIGAVVWMLMIAGVVVVFSRQRRRRRRVGAGAAGTIYDLMYEDKRNAVEFVVEERAAATDPEHRDGNLPDLEDPRGERTRR
jgi:hypothetical protein